MMLDDASVKIPGHKWLCGREAAVWTTFVAADCRSRIVIGSGSDPDARLPLSLGASIEF
jgi:hypothetical protein